MKSKAPPANGPWRPIERPGTVALVKAHILRTLAQGALGRGDALPPERELATAIGVSRMSLRRALAELHAEGFVLRSVGTSGGTRLTALTSPAAAARAALKRDRDRFAQVLEYRLALETMAASLAALRRNAADIKAIDLAIEAMRQSVDLGGFRQADGRFHTAVAQAARNTPISAAVVEARRDLFLLTNAEDEEVVRDTSLSAHSAIAAAIRKGDADAAARAMKAHIVEAGAELLGAPLKLTKL
jgi:GntR family transcriptional regulator, transcriptional repressor for pyruvate dehydrogenase complex